MLWTERPMPPAYLLMHAHLRVDGITKLVEKRASRRVDGVQVTTILSDAVDATNRTSTYAESRTQVHVVLHEPHALVARPARSISGV